MELYCYLGLRGGSMIFYDLINQFYKITSCSVFLNTYFNLNGEPAVQAEKDAIKAFYSSSIDILYLENFRLSKILKD